MNLNILKSFLHWVSQILSQKCQLFLSKTYDEQNKDVIHRYNVEEGRFRKTEEKLIRRNFIDFTVTATQLISLRSSYAGFGGDLIVEIADLAESIYVEPVQSRTFRINGHYNPTDFSIFEKNRLKEFHYFHTF